MKIRGLVQGHTDIAWHTGNDVSGSHVTCSLIAAMIHGTLSYMQGPTGFLSRKAECHNWFKKQTNKQTNNYIYIYIYIYI